MSAQPVSPPHQPRLRSTDRAEARRAAEAAIDASTDFFGPVSNFGIPIAAVLDTQKDPELFVSPSPLFSQIHRLPPLSTSVVDSETAQLIYHVMVQDIRPYDWRASPLLLDLHAVLVCRDAEELPAVRVPLCEFRGADDPSRAVHEVLEVCRDPIAFHASYMKRGFGRLEGHLEKKFAKTSNGSMQDFWERNC